LKKTVGTFKGENCGYGTGMICRVEHNNVARTEKIKKKGGKGPIHRRTKRKGPSDIDKKEKMQKVV